VDFEDATTVSSEPANAMMGTAVAGRPDRATKAAFKLAESRNARPEADAGATAAAWAGAGR
jgi:cell division GTPase FtsZ